MSLTMNRRAVVIGSSGYLGGHLARELSRAGFAVMGIARSAGSVATQSMITMDLASCSAAELHAVLARTRPVVVVNAAGALWGVDDTMMWNSNVRLVEKVLSVLPAGTRLVQLGSIYEYGRQPASVAISEAAVPRPISTYGLTKLRASERVLEHNNAVVLRLANAIGPGAPAASLLGGVAIALRMGTTQSGFVLDLPALAGTRDFVDVRDVAAAVVAAADPQAAVGVFNIGSGRSYLVADVVERLVAHSGVDAGRRVGEWRDPTRDGGVGDQLIDIGAAYRKLHWSPVFGLDDSLRQLWQHTSRFRAASESC